MEVDLESLDRNGVNLDQQGFPGFENRGGTRRFLFIYQGLKMPEFSRESVF